jgi:uncharacterized protein (TIGR02271 family)
MSEPQYVFSSDGRRGVIVQDQDPATDDRRFLKVRFDDTPDLIVPAELLELRPDGTYYLNAGHAEFQVAANAAAVRTTPLQASELEARSVGAAGEGRMVLPVVAEELRVGKRVVDTGVVRVRKLVREHEETVEQPITREEVQIERVPVGRVVDAIPQPRNEGDTLVIPVLEEVLVVEKRVMLKEEVRVTWRRTEEVAPQRVVLRSEEVVVERDHPQATDGATESPAAFNQPQRTDLSEGI